MIMRVLPAPPALAETVSSITVLQVDRLCGEWDIPLVAKAAPSIVYQETEGRSQLVLYGQNVFPFSFRASGRLLMIAWFLHPHRLAPLFGFRAAEVTDRCIDVSALAPFREICLAERLGAAGSDVTGRLRLMTEGIMRLCAASKWKPNELACYASRIIREGRGLVSLRELQESLQVTERSFQRVFAGEIGLSPKQYSRICQFQGAFEQLSLGRYSRLSDLAYDNGYADQSHLIRSCREFTGFAPGEYLERTAAFFEAVGR